MGLFNFLKKTKPPRPTQRVYILENELKIPLVWKDDEGKDVSFSYSYGYENGWLKICLWGGTAYKKRVDEQEVEKIIQPIKDLQLREDQVHTYLQKIGGFEHWDYYEEYYKSETIYI